jgi:hypothetical protein
LQELSSVAWRLVLQDGADVWVVEADLERRRGNHDVGVRVDAGGTGRRHRYSNGTVQGPDLLREVPELSCRLAGPSVAAG